MSLTRVSRPSISCLVLVVCLGGVLFGSRHARAARPNIVFLFADDQRADTIHAHGNPHIDTPNLDQLSREGFSFRRNYCAGSYSGAVCVASRAMLMTGMHWKKIKASKDPKNWAGLKLLPELLREQASYHTHIVGKWHNGQKTLVRSFDSGKSIYVGGMADHTDFQVQDLANRQLSEKRDAGGFSSEVFADAAVEFIESADSDTPYFLYVAFTAPHDPRNPPLSFRERYYQDRPPLPKNFLPQHPFFNAPQATSGRDESLLPWPRPEGMLSDQLCEYYGLVTHLDAQVGRIMKAIDEANDSRETYIVYTADHGLALGSHGLLGKQNVYEQSMSSPLILKGPEIPAGKSTEAFSYIHDLYATVCGFASVQVPEEADTLDLSGIWQGKKDAVHEAVYLPFQDNQRAVRDTRWKLHIYPQINHKLLFDLQNDPHETKDLSVDPQYASEIERLTALMELCRQEVGDDDPLVVDEALPKEPVYDSSKRKPDRWQPKWIRQKYFGEQ